MRETGAVLQSDRGTRMALERVSARGRLDGLLFQLTVEQHYRNPHATNVEVVHTFPLPFDAVLLDLDVELAGRKLCAAVVEKRESEQRYEDAIDKGDSAILLERAGDGLYALNLGNLMANERAVIRYRYAQLLRFEHGSVRLAIPTVIAPRYGNPRNAGLAPHQAPSTDFAASYPFDLVVDLHGDVASGALASPSHAIATRRTVHGAQVTLARPAVLDRDLVLTVGELANRSLTVVARDGDGYVALASFCADLPEVSPPLPLRLKVLVDCSGSMAGDSIGAARRALHRVLMAFGSADRFSLTRFGSKVVDETRGFVAGDDAGIRRAANCVASMEANLGGTELSAALHHVFAQEEGAADVLLITDGECWDSEGLAKVAHAYRQRVFVVGIGSAPTEGLLKRLALDTGGACDFIAPNEDAEGAIVRMFKRLRAERIERADMAWPGQPAWTLAPEGGLFAGETVHAFASFAERPIGAVRATLVAEEGACSPRAQVELPEATIEDRTLARVAAARRIEHTDAHEALALALRYRLLTERTNLLVIHERTDEDRADDLPRLAQVAQMHAAGWHGVGSVACSMALLTGPLESRVLAKRADLLDAEDVCFDMLSRSPLVDSVDGGPATPVADELLPYLEKLLSHSGALLSVKIPDLPSGMPVSLRQALSLLIERGYAEAEVIRALFEAAVAFHTEGRLSTQPSRQLMRALRNAPTLAEEVRAALRARLPQLQRKTTQDKVAT